MEPTDYNWVYYRLNDGRELKIREVTVEDTELLLAYIDKVSGETDNLNFGVGEFGFTYDEERNYLENIRRSENAIYLLGFLDDTLISALSFSCEQRERTMHTGEFGVTVLEAYWGLGIGAAMLTTLIEWAKISGIIRKINLTVRSDNKRAIQLYEKLGFKYEGTRTRDLYIRGVFYDGILMGMAID
jgi:RimJ/RimL family protein N-acetyltransferase